MLLRYVERLSVGEVARIMGKSEKAVERLLQRAEERPRQEMLCWLGNESFRALCLEVLTVLRSREEGSWTFEGTAITLHFGSDVRKFCYVRGCADEFLAAFPAKRARLNECFIRKAAEDGPSWSCR